MCGITGCLPRNGLPEAMLRERVLGMTAALVHRGPDDSGSFISRDVGLGVRRLSIIDRAQGHQPMQSDDGRLVLVFNGEIYNHRALRRALEAQGAAFRTDSDTEVVLRLLEREAADGVRKLEGMFCFALWNAATRELMLVRDWLGQKSLYWTETPDGVYFASEIKALLCIPGVVSELDVEALSHYLSLRYLPGESTFFRGIRKLPAAHVMTLGQGARRVRELWRPAYEPKHSLTESQIIERLDGLLGEVVAEHLMSEVPLGAFLSGGIDSSLVVQGR
jgi:asparagine synthase (glutamine-hydrolysing)